MEPHIYLKRGKKSILLVRYFDKFHFIELDHQMHRHARKWLLACPRNEEEMDRWHISRSTIAAKYVRGVAAGGTGRGQVVQFYLQDGKRRYELERDCDLADMSALFDGLDSFEPPKLQSNWQDPRLAKQDPKLRSILWGIGAALNTVSFITGSMVFAGGFRVPWISAICLLCIPAAVVLYCLFPIYFTTYEGKRGYGKKRSVMMLYTLVIAPAGLLLGAMVHCCIFAWWKAWVIGAGAVIALAVMLWKLVPDFRDAGKLIPFLLLGILLSAGPVLAVNDLLDTAPVSEIRSQVVDTDYVDSTRGQDTYYLIVNLEGREKRIPVDEEVFENTQAGDSVRVQLHGGALGIPYAELAD